MLGLPRSPAQGGTCRREDGERREREEREEREKGGGRKEREMKGRRRKRIE